MGVGRERDATPVPHTGAAREYATYRTDWVGTTGRERSEEGATKEEARADLLSSHQGGGWVPRKGVSVPVSVEEGRGGGEGTVCVCVGCSLWWTATCHGATPARVLARMCACALGEIAKTKSAPSPRGRPPRPRIA